MPIPTASSRRWFSASKRAISAVFWRAWKRAPDGASNIRMTKPERQAIDELASVVTDRFASGLYDSAAGRAGLGRRSRAAPVADRTPRLCGSPDRRGCGVPDARNPDQQPGGYEA